MSRIIAQPCNRDGTPGINFNNTVDKKLNKEVLKFELKSGEDDKLFGSVTTQMISDELHNKGYSIDKKDIFMDESIKSIGNHYVTIHLGENLDSKVKIKVKSETIK